MLNDFELTMESRAASDSCGMVSSSKSSSEDGLTRTVFDLIEDGIPELKVKLKGGFLVDFEDGWRDTTGSLEPVLRLSIPPRVLF